MQLKKNGACFESGVTQEKQILNRSRPINNAYNDGFDEGSSTYQEERLIGLTPSEVSKFGSKKTVSFAEKKETDRSSQMLGRL